jgi:hypothetical protein
MIELVQSNDAVLISFATSLLTEAGIEHRSGRPRSHHSGG